MQKLVRHRSQKAGLPPGSLVHIGERKIDETQITLIEYCEDSFIEKLSNITEVCQQSKDRARVRWINVDGIHDIDVIEKLGKAYGIHPLALEDILNTVQRPKVENYGDYIYIAAKMLYYDNMKGEFVTEQESFILGENFVISFSERDTEIFNPVRERIRQGVGKIRKLGTDYLVYALLDVIVDNYFVVLEELGEKIEYTEDEVVVKPSPDTLQAIHKLKRQMVFLHKSVWPMREVIGSIQRGESSLIKDSTDIYIRDLYDNVIQVMDITDTLRDILSSMLDIYLSSVSNRMNEIMKVLTIISTLFIPITFIVGLYGMNLKSMPEYDWPYMYPLVWVIIISTTIAMLAFFKKKKWL